VDCLAGSLLQEAKPIAETAKQRKYLTGII